MAERTARNLLRATDAFYALAKNEEIYPCFADDDLAAVAKGIAAPGPSLDRRVWSRACSAEGQPSSRSCSPP